MFVCVPRVTHRSVLLMTQRPQSTTQSNSVQCFQKTTTVDARNSAKYSSSRRRGMLSTLRFLPHRHRQAVVKPFSRERSQQQMKAQYCLRWMKRTQARKTALTARQLHSLMRRKWGGVVTVVSPRFGDTDHFRRFSQPLRPSSTATSSAVRPSSSL